jgi:hypothetical protein
MAILPSVQGLAAYAGFLETLMTRLFESRMRRYGAALPRPEKKPKPKFKPAGRRIAARHAPACQA